MSIREVINDLCFYQPLIIPIPLVNELIPSFASQAKIPVTFRKLNDNVGIV